MNQQCVLVAKAANRLGCIRKSIARRSSEVILLLYICGLTTAEQCCVQFQAPQHKGDILEGVQ